MKADSDQEIEKDERRNPIKRNQREKEFRTVGQFKEIVTNPVDAYEILSKYDKSIKSVKKPHPIHKGLSIIDFSLAARGPQEDEVYAEQPFFRNNIRRGNTVVVNPQQKQFFWGRRGLMKFFDISQKSIKAIIQSDTKGIYKKDQSIHYAIFSEVQNVLSCNEELPIEHKAKVHMYRLNKANGENAQIGYFPATDDWIISSKNVSMLVKEPADIKAYEGQRYGFAALIALTWFELIFNLKKEQIQELKHDLTGKTLVGQYCGNPDFQHLVKYSETTIFFYALVEHRSTYTCLPPPETFVFLEKHKLPIVKNYQNSLYGKYVDFIEFGKALAHLFDTVSTSSIFEDQEGSVIYFLIEKPREYCQYISDRYLQKSVPIPENWKEKDVWWNVASLGKLKTLEYRILRKLREKLKYFTRLKKGDQTKNQNQQKKMQEKYGSFQREVYKLIKEKELSKPVEYFFCAAIIAFDYVFKNRKSPRNLILLSEHYLDFLSVIFWSIQNKKEVTHQMMADEEFHKELRKTSWQNYGTEIVQHYPELLEKLAPKYAKIKKSLNIEELGEGEDQPEGDDN